MSPIEAGFCPSCGLDFSEPYTGPVARRTFWGDMWRRTRPFRLPVAATAVFFIPLVIAGLLINMEQNARINALRNSGVPTPIPVGRVLVSLHDLPRGYRFSSTEANLLGNVVAWQTRPWDSIPYYAITEWDVSELGGIARVLGGKVAGTDIARESAILDTMLADGVYDTTGLGQNIAAVVPREITSLQYGVSEGIINDENWVDEWRFWGSARQRVTLILHVTDGDLLPTLMLWAELPEQWVAGERETDGQTLTFRVVLPETGWYIASVSRERLSAGQSNGAYELMGR